MKRTRKYCLCGCRETVSKGKRFIMGHNFRMANNTSEEAEKRRREKIGVFSKQHWNDPEIRKKMFASGLWDGRSQTEEVKKKISAIAIIREAKKKENGFVVSEETRRKLSAARMGHSVSEETRRKISEKVKGRVFSDVHKKALADGSKKYTAENGNPFKGKTHSKESLQKMSDALFGKYRGEKASNWQGGIDSLPYSIEWTKWFKKEIKERDNYTCQNPECVNSFPVLDVHHIDYNKNNCSPDNVITLCKKCHGLTQKNRQEWIKIYQNIVVQKRMKRKRRIV